MLNLNGVRNAIQQGLTTVHIHGSDLLEPKGSRLVLILRPRNSSQSYRMLVKIESLEEI